MSFFDSEEELLEGVKLEFPITPDWLEKECEFTFVQFTVSVADGSSLTMHIHEHSNVKIYMFHPMCNSSWTIKVYNNNLLCHHQYISTRRDFMDVVAKLKII